MSETAACLLAGTILLTNEKSRLSDNSGNNQSSKKQQSTLINRETRDLLLISDTYCPHLPEVEAEAERKKRENDRRDEENERWEWMREKEAILRKNCDPLKSSLWLGGKNWLSS